MIARRTPLTRASRLLARLATPRRSDVVRDPDCVSAVHALPCCAADLSPCGGPIEADHAGKKSGMSRKADDTTCIPLCRDHCPTCGQRGHGIDDGTTTWRECAACHTWGHVQHRAD